MGIWHVHIPREQELRKGVQSEGKMRNWDGRASSTREQADCEMGENRTVWEETVANLISASKPFPVYPIVWHFHLKVANPNA